MTVDFSWLKNNKEQVLLFDKSPNPSDVEGKLEIKDEFYNKGFTTIKNIDSLEQAATVAHQFINSLDTNKLPLLKRFKQNIRLSKSNPIPVCEPCVQSSYVALHYDMGLPITSDPPQLLQVLIALWLPKDAPDATTITRLVPINKFKDQKTFGKKSEVEQLLINYANNHGDGWTKPTPHNTKRIAAFGRILDAVTKKNQLTDWPEYLMDEWFQKPNDEDGSKSMKWEHDFFKECGIDLKLIEHQIKLERGDLLIFDNLRVCHGRIGKRPKEELHQFMFGVKEISKQDIDTLRLDLVDQLASQDPDL